jgi:hypothetical protein
MKYAVLLHQDESIWEKLTDHERRVYVEQHDRFDTLTAELGVTVVASEALCGVSTATTMRRRGEDVTVTDGPVSATAESFGGFYLVEAPSLDQVLEAARVLPEYTIEIRPVAELD